MLTSRVVLRATAIERELGRGPSTETTHTVLLNGSQLKDLESDLKTATEPEESPEGSESSLVGSWEEVYYDNANYSLTLRGWWLMQRTGNWILKVPTYECVSETEARHTGFETLTDLGEILERCGLMQHAKAWKSGKSTNAERLLSQVGVCPFASVNTERRSYVLRQKIASSAANTEDAKADVSGDMKLAVTLDALRFDVQHAEELAVSEILFAYGEAARDMLKVAVAEFTLVEERGVKVPRQAELVASLEARGFDTPVSSTVVCPKLTTYLSLCRPAHMRALCRGGIFGPTPVSGDGAAKS